MPYFFYLVMDGPAADAQGVGGLFLDPARLAEGPDDGLPLALLQGEGGAGPHGGVFGRFLQLQVVRCQGVVAAKDQGGLQRVLQLPDVAGPGVGPEPGLGVPG